MEVDQKHITTVRMHDAKGNDICLVKEGQDYRLQLSSNRNVVNITLGVHDLRKLCQQIMQLDIEENWRSQSVTPPEFKSFFFGGAPRSFQETMASWFARMAAGDFGDRTSTREAAMRS